jgi:outer membrane protein OmpA-like peptidoglycan-associated protein
MKIPFWLLALLLLLWGIWSFKNYYCDKCGCCGGETAAISAAGPAIPMFACGESALTAGNFTAFRDSVLKTGGQGDTLIISGVYYADETEAIGRARAEAFRKVLGTKVPDNRVRLATRKLEGNCAAAAAAGLRGVDLNWTKLVLKINEGAIIESDNAVTFLFPFNSTEKDRDPRVEEYLAKLVEKHKSTNATFTVVGHADNVGNDEGNMKIGMGRAESIARILTKGGISADRIQTSSKGKSEPVADNATDDGRHQNRRVVVTINQ